VEGQPTGAAAKGASGKRSRTKTSGADSDELVGQHKIKFVQVAGHSGHTENDRCDELAVAAYQNT